MEAELCAAQGLGGTNIYENCGYQVIKDPDGTKKKKLFG